MSDLALQRLFDLASSLATEKSMDRLLDRVLDAMIAVSGAQRGFVVLVEEGEASLRRAQPSGTRGRASWTILGRVLAENRPLIVVDALDDPDFCGARSVQRERVRSVCALPLRTPREAVGAVYLDHKSASGAFAEELLEKLHAFAGLAAVAIRNLQRSAPLPPEPPVVHPRIVAIDSTMKRVLRMVGRFADLPYPVYVHGESGTGKELIARAIHDEGARRAGPFVAANCAAISGSIAESELFGHQRGAFTGADRDRKGLFEEAHGGTLFLDEVEAMPPSLQEKLLRVLQGGEVRRVGGNGTVRVDVRVVSASNEDIELLAGFRRDLFYRLNVLRVDLPPLRERRGDLPALVEHFLARIACETGGGPREIAPAALERLAKHTWPGNVRELENVLRRAWAMAESDPLGPDDFLFLDRACRTVDADEPVRVEEHVRRMIERYGGRMNNRELAEFLGMSRKTVWKYKQKWGLA